MYDIIQELDLALPLHNTQTMSCIHCNPTETPPNHLRLTVPELRDWLKHRGAIPQAYKDLLVSRGWAYRQCMGRWLWCGPDWQPPIEVFDPSLLVGTALTAAEIKSQLKLGKKTALAPVMTAAGWRWVWHLQVRYWCHPSHVWDHAIDLSKLSGSLTRRELLKLTGQVRLTRELKAALRAAGWHCTRGKVWVRART